MADAPNVNGPKRLPEDFDLTLASGRLRARRWGAADAPLLLCVHGLSANLSAFTRLAEDLAGADRQIVAVDLRGCGRSEITAPGSYGLDSHAADVLAVADRLGAAEFDLAGWSLGALICLQTALRSADRLRTVTLIDHAGPAQRAALAVVGQWVQRLGLVTDTAEDYLRSVRRSGYFEPFSPFWAAFHGYELAQRTDGRWSPTTSTAAADEDFNQAWPRNWAEHWRALRMPAVLVRAVQPMNGALVVPDRAVSALREANPSVRVVDLPASNHFTCVTDPLATAAVADVLAATAAR